MRKQSEGSSTFDLISEKEATSQFSVAVSSSDGTNLWNKPSNTEIRNFTDFIAIVIPTL